MARRSVDAQFLEIVLNDSEGTVCSILLVFGGSLVLGNLVGGKLTD